jgi:hypothetical protein
MLTFVFAVAREAVDSDSPLLPESPSAFLVTGRTTSRLTTIPSTLPARTALATNSPEDQPPAPSESSSASQAPDETPQTAEPPNATAAIPSPTGTRWPVRTHGATASPDPFDPGNHGSSSASSIVVGLLIAAVIAIFVVYCLYRRYMQRMGGRGSRTEAIPSDDGAVLAEFHEEERGAVMLPSIAGRTQGNAPSENAESPLVLDS